MGPSSGLIIAFVVAVWAAYFVPLVLRRYDEAGKNASVETGRTGRVIAATASAPSASVETSTPVETSATGKADTAVVSGDQQSTATAGSASAAYDRPAARLAARRRRALLTLLAGLVVTTGLAAASIVPWFGVAAPVVLIAAWLVACRIQVRGELGISRSARTTPDELASVKKSADEEDTVIVSGQFEDVDPARLHVMEQTSLAVDALDDQVVIAVPSVSTGGEALWDPLPVTLPTYVTKPRAGRTVRTIDFTKPGAWTSGHIEGEDVELPQRAGGESGTEERRAVGS